MPVLEDITPLSSAYITGSYISVLLTTFSSSHQRLTSSINLLILHLTHHQPNTPSIINTHQISTASMPPKPSTTDATTLDPLTTLLLTFLSENDIEVKAGENYHMLGLTNGKNLFVANPSLPLPLFLHLHLHPTSASLKTDSE